MECQKRLQRLIGTVFVFLLVVGCSPSAVNLTPSQPDAHPSRVTPTVAQPTSTIFQTPTVTNVVALSSSATPMPKSPAPGTVLFEENFDDGLAQDFTYISGNWNVLVDETGNKVFDGDNKLSSSEPLSAGFGSIERTDYAIDYRVRIQDGDIWLSIGNNDQGDYVLRLSLPYSHVSLYVSPANIGWQTLMVQRYHLEREVWYHVRVEAQGEMLRVFIDDKLEIEKLDCQIHSGNLAFGVLGGTGNHVQFDDIRVTVLAPANPDEP